MLSGAITATTLLAGTLLINALIPIRSDKKDAATYGIQGLRNQAQPDGVVPGLLGFHRSTPPYGMLPYTESVGDDRFVTANFIHGYGPIATRNHRIGETPIEKYQEVTAEHREGRPGDAPLTLTPRQVVERALSIELLNAGPGAEVRKLGSPRRTSRAFSVDIGFPGGLGGIDKDGKKVGVEATFTLRYRKVGTETWATRPISVYAKLSGKPFTRTFAYDVTDRGLYEIEITRTSGDFDRPDQDFSKKEIQRTGRSQWSVLRSFRPEYPINFDAPLAVSAIRIRATGQLNGTLDEYNCDAFCICPDWDAASWHVDRARDAEPGLAVPARPDGPGRRLSAHGRRGRRAGRLARLLCRERPDVQPDPRLRGVRPRRAVGYRRRRAREPARQGRPLGRRCRPRPRYRGRPHHAAQQLGLQG